MQEATYDFVFFGCCCSACCFSRSRCAAVEKRFQKAGSWTTAIVMKGDVLLLGLPPVVRMSSECLQYLERRRSREDWGFSSSVEVSGWQVKF